MKEEKSAYPAFISKLFFWLTTVGFFSCVSFFHTGKSHMNHFFPSHCRTRTKHRVMKNSAYSFFSLCWFKFLVMLCLKTGFAVAFQEPTNFQIAHQQQWMREREKKKLGSDGLRNIISSKNRLCMKIEIIVRMNYRRMMCTFSGYSYAHELSSMVPILNNSCSSGSNSNSSSSSRSRSGGSDSGNCPNRWVHCNDECTNVCVHWTFVIWMKMYYTTVDGGIVCKPYHQTFPTQTQAKIPSIQPRIMDKKNVWFLFFITKNCFFFSSWLFHFQMVCFDTVFFLSASKWEKLSYFSTCCRSFTICQSLTTSFWIMA